VTAGKREEAVLVVIAVVLFAALMLFAGPQKISGPHPVGPGPSAAEATQWPLASGWWCWPPNLTPGPHASRVGGPRERPCYQPEVDHWIYGKPWPGDLNNDGVIDD